MDVVRQRGPNYPNHFGEMMDELGEQGHRRIYRVMQRVLRTAMDRGPDMREFPRSYLAHRRREGLPCPRCSAPLQRLIISQRSCYFCRECQGPG